MPLLKYKNIIVVFQTKRSGSQTADSTAFDHLQVHNMYEMLNTEQYPFIDMALKFTQRKTSRAYRAQCNFKENYIGINVRVLMSGNSDGVC